MKKNGIVFFLKKLLLGDPEKERALILPIEGYKEQIINIKKIWNNDTGFDFGVERLLRLSIAFSQFLLPGIHIREIFKRNSGIVIEFYVILKIFIPVLFLALGITKSNLVFLLVLYLIIDTAIYLASCFFLSDIEKKARSDKRTIILIFLNYIGITLGFAVLYSHFAVLWKLVDTIKVQASNFEAIYFSFVTTATIGYGDFSPCGTMGQMLVICQSILFFIFLGIFLNFFANKIK
jgi:hypothetical protein